MDRRNFMHLAVGSSATVALGNATARTAGTAIAAQDTPALPATPRSLGAAGPAGAVYYTSADPGRWAGKAATHVPVVEVSKGAGGVLVQVATSHEMKGYEHYIVKHVVLDKDYRFLAEKLFDPAKDSTALSSFNLGQYQGSVTVLSMCNQHDVWLTRVEV
jgi:superoxide reductase